MRRHLEAGEKGKRLSGPMGTLNCHVPRIVTTVGCEVGKHTRQGTWSGVQKKKWNGVGCCTDIASSEAAPWEGRETICTRGLGRGITAEVKATLSRRETVAWLYA